MLNMSFYKGTLNRKELIEFIINTDKSISYTFGFSWKNPKTNCMIISKQEAITIVQEQDLLEAEEGKYFLNLNAYHINDMY